MQRNMCCIRRSSFYAEAFWDIDVDFLCRVYTELFRNKLVGKWAASLIKPEDEEIYVKEVRLSNLEKPGDDDLIDKLLNDFELKNLGIEKQEIIKKIEECSRLAVEKFSKT